MSRHSQHCFRTSQSLLNMANAPEILTNDDSLKKLFPPSLNASLAGNPTLPTLRTVCEKMLEENRKMCNILGRDLRWHAQSHLKTAPAAPVGPIGVSVQHQVDVIRRLHDTIFGSILQAQPYIAAAVMAALRGVGPSRPVAVDSVNRWSCLTIFLYIITA
ncbi:unnamed protein product [Bursaphelenchus okinawaensis]|uniref:Uncharacterized protein n=1 Tax=Bursaphelenchus okinawaensis TaxID=465554 RepID=A0A811K3J1_9BILA|nr:unnamed protein product [Bursaphelenchus okinawaensis]CAG9091193.1 unnamed protein product [Bursaphelenchus okinawaensis]